MRERFNQIRPECDQNHSWSYRRCSSCLTDKRQVLPTGPLDASIMLIGDVSGRWEDQLGMPFAGVPGKELDRTYLPLAHLSRPRVFITNIVQCRCTRNDQDVKPTESIIRSCYENHISEEIWTVNPKMIILCGATACAMAGISKLEFEHGFPRYVHEHAELYGWSGFLVPMYHPAAGMHESKFMIPQLEDWERLGEFLQSPPQWIPPPMRASTISSLKSKRNYFLVSTRDEVQGYFQTYGDKLDHQMPRILAIDSESDEGKDWSIQVSVEPNTGLMILLESKDAINELAMFVHDLIQCGWQLIFHNHDADIDLCEHIGIDCSVFRDTMQELFHLGNLPQGLKAAVYRTLGKRMMSYVDVVVPWSKSKLMEWLAEALNYAEDNLAESIPHPVGKYCPTCGKTHRKDVSKSKPHESESVLRRVMKYCVDNADYDPWIKAKTNARGEETIRLFGRSWLPLIESSIGRMPRQSIVHVPIVEARDYGCSDADHTWQLALYLEQERARIVKHEWKVA